jgi:peroxiredoxin
MKVSFLLITIICSITSVAQQSYVIKGTSDTTGTWAYLDVYSKTRDSVFVKDGKFEFRGKVDGPRFMSIQVKPGRVSRIILEPGEITVHYKKSGDYTIGGTANNKRLEYMDEAIKPYYDKVAVAWKKYNTEKDEARAAAFREWEAAQEVKRAKYRELILADPNFSGFLFSLPTYRDETAPTVKKYLAQFKHFSGDDGYKRMAEYYKGAANTDFGVQAPDWKRPNANGEDLKLSSLRGKYVLIDFWYAGCVWCRRMTPHLIKVYNDIKDDGLEIVSVSIDTKENEQKWRDAMKEDGAPWLQAWDFEKKLPAEYGVLAYPTMFLLDKEGRVVEKIIGYREEPALRALFAKYIPSAATAKNASNK